MAEQTVGERIADDVRPSGFSKLYERTTHAAAIDKAIAEKEAQAAAYRAALLDIRTCELPSDSTPFQIIAMLRAKASEAALASTAGEALLARLKALGDQLEFDRTAVADCLTAANRAIDSRHWLTDGRGPYEWDDDRYRDEFRTAAMEIKAALEPLTKIAANWKDCPQSAAEIANARIDLLARLRAAERESRLMNKTIANDAIEIWHLTQRAEAAEEKAETLAWIEANRARVNRIDGPSSMPNDTWVISHSDDEPECISGTGVTLFAAIQDARAKEANFT